MSNELTSVDWLKLAHEAEMEQARLAYTSGAAQVKAWKTAFFVTAGCLTLIIVVLLSLAHLSPVEVGKKQSQDVSKNQQTQEYMSKGGK